MTDEKVETPHKDGHWCADLRCSKCYGADTWQTSEVTKLRAELERVKVERDELQEWKDGWMAHDSKVPIAGCRCDYCAALQRATTLEAALEKARENEGRWIPVSERLPELDVTVLIFDQHGVGSGDYAKCPLGVENPNWVRWGSGATQVTHWMPLPEPPAIDAARTK